MNQASNKYYIVGMPGIGKSHYLSQIKEMSDVTCLDLDDIIESEYLSTIPLLISQKGIEIFRIYEAITLRKQHLKNTPALIACGGGTPCYHENMGWMNRTGVTIYLQASKEYLIENYAKYQLKRPLLGDRNLSEYIDKLYLTRIDYYRQSQFTIDVEKQSNQVANIIGEIIENHSAYIG